MPGTKVLVVEDDRTTLSLLADFLRRYGFEVETAEDGMEMFCKSVPGDFDVIVTDLNMPNLSGAGAADLLKVSGCETPIICITGLSKSETKDLRSKFRVLIQKPINMSILNKIITHMVDHHKGAQHGNSTH